MPRLLPPLLASLSLGHLSPAHGRGGRERSGNQGKAILLLHLICSCSFKPHLSSRSAPGRRAYRHMTSRPSGRASRSLLTLESSAMCRHDRVIFPADDVLDEMIQHFPLKPYSRLSRVLIPESRVACLPRRSLNPGRSSAYSKRQSLLQPMRTYTPSLTC